MYHRDQAELPGGSIGPERRGSDNFRRWVRPGYEHDPLDRTLERTTVRHGADGWYLITAAGGASEQHAPPTAARRSGPYRQVAEAAEALYREIGPADEETGERSDAEHDPVERVVREGLTARLFDACRRWTRQTESGQVASAVNGQGAPPAWARQQVLDVSRAEGGMGEELRTLLTAVLTAADADRIWRES